CRPRLFHFLLPTPPSILLDRPVPLATVRSLGKPISLGNATVKGPRAQPQSQPSTSHFMRPQRSSGAALASATAVVLATGFHTQAQDAKPPDKPPEKKGWETVASLGASLTRGNSDSFLATFGVNTARKWSKDEIL